MLSARTSWFSDYTFDLLVSHFNFSNIISLIIIYFCEADCHYYCISGENPAPVFTIFIHIGMCAS